MEWINETEYTRETLGAMNRIARATVGKERERVLRPAIFLLGAAGVAAAILTLEKVPQLVTALCLVYGVLFLWVSLFWRQMQDKSSQRMLRRGVRRCVFTFLPQAISVENEVENLRYGYYRLSAMAEDGRYLVLFFDKKHAMILDKQGFREGTAESLVPFLEEQTELKIETIAGESGE